TRLWLDKTPGDRVVIGRRAAPEPLAAAASLDPTERTTERTAERTIDAPVVAPRRMAEAT
ncbi:MAG: hypothetical protein ABIV63_07175, partial [Caldimonas sp.]